MGRDKKRSRSRSRDRDRDRDKKEKEKSHAKDGKRERYVPGYFCRPILGSTYRFYWVQNCTTVGTVMFRLALAPLLFIIKIYLISVHCKVQDLLQAYVSAQDV